MELCDPSVTDNLCALVPVDCGFSQEILFAINLVCDESYSIIMTVNTKDILMTKKNQKKKST